MKTTERTYLKGSVWLYRDENGSFAEEYRIRSVIGEGGSSVCYEAARRLSDGGEETGKLKEFYPVDEAAGDGVWCESLKRLPDGQLIPEPGMDARFGRMCRDYLDTYRLLRNVMADHPENEVLKNYIQQGEILYGYCGGREGSAAEAGQKATVYIWSPGVAGKGFDVYLKEVRENPAYRPEERLRDILCVLDTLADCLKAMHTAGLLHMDVKPSNFLVPYNSDFQIQPGQVSLFDISTLCSVDHSCMAVSGTDGYCAPEVVRGRADNRSDIYSIGAMLFQAVVITEEIADGKYRDFYYQRIGQLVRHSALFLNSETNSDEALMSRICRILEKCLARDPRKRYQSCSELREDLAKARKRLERLLCAPVGSGRDGVTDPTIVIQKLLYEHPLYEAVTEGEKEIRVLVIGGGTYSQRFLDLCLQSGQMDGVSLHVAAVSDEPEEERENYLRFRPAMAEFVNVNGSLKGREETAFASLKFQKRSLHPLQESWHYVFVDLGEDAAGYLEARQCAKEVARQKQGGCPVCYVIRDAETEMEEDAAAGLYPVPVYEPVTLETIGRHLGEMAFSTHLSWNSGRNIPVAEERERFFGGTDIQDQYNRRSSIAYALSLKYKLHSVGIDGDDPQKAAGLFADQILKKRETDEEARKKFDQLVDLEHRRWVLDRAADGWTAPRDEQGQLKLEECVIRGSVKDEVNRTHPCMVRGSGRSPLSGAEYRANHHAKWDEGEPDLQLDELDRMSVALHRCMKRYADRLKQEEIYQNPDLIYIQNRIPEGYGRVQKAFGQFQFVLKNILNGVESYSRQYDLYQRAFLSALKELPDEGRVKIEERVQVLRRAFFPVIESNLYRNYKANDEVLIEKIPFILSWRQVSVIVMAFEDGKGQNGRNEAVFANVAAATVLNPEKIYFLYCLKKEADTELLIRKLDAILTYMGTRGMHCGIRLIAACLDETTDQEQEHLRAELARLREKDLRSGRSAWFEGAEIFEAEDDAEAAEIFTGYLKEHPVDLFDGGNQLFASAFDNAQMIGTVTGMGIPYFEYDWRHKKFTRTIGCEYLRFVKDHSFLRIQDMFALMNVSEQSFHLPEYAEDYEKLWEIYTGSYLSTKKFENGVGNWNRLCSCLRRYEEARAPLARFDVGEAGGGTVDLIWFLPEYTYHTVKKILAAWIRYGIADQSSVLVSHASDTCRLEICTDQCFEQQMNQVFENPQQLLPYYGVSVRKYSAGSREYVEICCNDLTVRDVSLDQDGTERWRFGLEVLKQLEKAHFIRQLTQNPERPRQVSFTYSSPRIKELLTTAGMLLEIYAYYDILKTGYFDDVACGYEFCWESGGVKNELDLVMTKGFCSMIVECKAVQELKLNYYHKLHSIADQFGIGTVKVLLGNTYAQSNAQINEMNEMQRSRGKQLQILTVSDPEQILHIGETLKEFMENH